MIRALARRLVHPRRAGAATLVTLSIAAAAFGCHSAAGGASDPMPNLALPTGGGNQLWADVAYDGGWRVQRHVWTGHARLLDRNDVRRAWGSEENCRAALAERAPGLENASLPVAVVLHGLWRSRDSMSAITEALEESGFEVLDVAYPSTRGTIAEHAAQVAELLDGLRGEGREVSFVTHSLGGLVTRALLAREGDAWRARHRLGRAVFIAAPHRGAALARVGAKLPGALTLYGEPSQEMARGVAATLPIPPLPFLDVAAARGRRRGGTLWCRATTTASSASRRRAWKERRRASSCAGRTRSSCGIPRSSGPRWSSCSPTDEELFLGGVKAPQPHGGSRLPRSRQSAAPRVHERAALARAR